MKLFSMSILINLKLLPKDKFFGLYVLKNNNNAKAITNFFHLFVLASNKIFSIRLSKLIPLYSAISEPKKDSSFLAEY